MAYVFIQLFIRTIYTTVCFLNIDWLLAFVVTCFDINMLCLGHGYIVKTNVVLQHLIHIKYFRSIYVLILYSCTIKAVLIGTAVAREREREHITSLATERTFATCHHSCSQD
jgi:hypothetical protein